MEQINLTKEELKEFVGGHYESYKLANDDVNNVNTKSGCMCEYDNRSLTNSNSVDGCGCRCI
jgi:hypothetical protein